MKKDIFVWEPLENNSVFKLVNVNGEFAKDVLISIMLNDDVGAVEIYDRKKKDYQEHEVKINFHMTLWDDVLEKLHEVLDIDRETVIHVFSVRLGVFRKYLHYEIVEYNRAYEWTVKFVDGNNVKIDVGNFIEKGYRIALSLTEEIKPLELYSQVGLAEALGKSRQNIRYHLEKGNLLKPIALVDGRPAWNQDQVDKMMKLKEKGLL